ncbi:regulatory protein RecX, partial [Patescibacteria group bacterium]
DNFIKAGLKVGQDLGEKDIEKLLNEDLREKVFGWALRLLSYRPRAEKEIINYLRRKKVTSSLIDQTVLKLKKKKLLNDEEFARWFIDQRITFRPRGKRAIMMELRRKGVGQKLAQSLVEEMVDELVLANF